MIDEHRCSLPSGNTISSLDTCLLAVYRFFRFLCPASIEPKVILAPQRLIRIPRDQLAPYHFQYLSFILIFEILPFTPCQRSGLKTNPALFSHWYTSHIPSLNTSYLYSFTPIAPVYFLSTPKLPQLYS